MKRIALILSIIIVSAGVIIAGNYHWKQTVDKTTKKAKIALNVASNTTNVNKDSSVASTSESNTQNTQGAANSSSDSSKAQATIDQNGQQVGSEKTATTTNNSTNGTQSTNADTTQTNGSMTSNPTGSPSIKPTKKSVEEIKSQYRSLFNELEKVETSKIDQLVVAAKAEYVSKKISKTELAAKYQAAAKQMEQNADRSFYVLYQHLQYDLDKNGYSLNEAQEFQQAYNTKKQEHANRIVSQVRGF